jgi:hypothetical protein
MLRYERPWPDNDHEIPNLVHTKVIKKKLMNYCCGIWSLLRTVCRIIPIGSPRHEHDVAVHDPRKHCEARGGADTPPAAESRRPGNLRDALNHLDYQTASLSFLVRACPTRLKMVRAFLSRRSWCRAESPFLC